MVQYCIEVTLAWTVFYLIYLLFLRRETFFRANRWYLLHTLWLGALLPYLRKIPFSLTSSDNIIYDSVYYVNQSTQAVVASVSAETTSSIDWSTIILGLYLIGVIVTTMRLAVGLRKIKSLYKSGQKTKRGSYTLVMSEEFHLPFSFFKYVFLHQSFLEDDNLKEIITHELKHINDLHTLDILLTEVIAILFWWNPLVYLYKREIKQNHEFIADAYASQNSTLKNYGQILLGQSSSGIELALTHQFFSSHLKKRITMLYTTKSARYKMSKYLVVLPCLFFFALLFSSNTLVGDIDSLSELQSEATVLDTIPSSQKEAVAPESELIEIRAWAPAKKTNDIKDSPESIKNKKQYRPTVHVSEKTWYIDGVTDPLIVINGKISETDQEHYFTKSKITKVTALSLEESIAKYGQKGENGAIEFILNLKSDEPWVNAFANGFDNSDTSQPQNTLLIKDLTVYKVVDKMPRFLGCDQTKLSESEKQKCSNSKLLEFVYTNLKYPASAKIEGIEGTVVAQFVVNEDGSVSHFKIARSVSTDCDAAVLDMFIEMTKAKRWIPGMHEGEAVKVLYTIPVKFKLETAKPKKKKSTDTKPINRTSNKIDFIANTISIFNSENYEGGDCTDKVVLVDGKEIDSSKQLNLEVIEHTNIYNGEFPKELSKYEDHCSVLVITTKGNEPIVSVPPAPPAPPKLIHPHSDCQDTIITVDGKLFESTIYDIALINPEDIKEIHIYKDDVPEKLAHIHKNGCVNLAITTKNGSYTLISPPASTISAPHPPQDLPVLPTPLQPLLDFSNIALNQDNILPGSLTVKSGDKLLIEGEHYEVDYESGKLKILDETLIDNNVDIDISFDELETTSRHIDPEAEITLNIIENPVQNGILKFTYLSNLTKDVILSLYDIEGKRILQKKYDYTKDGLTADIPISEQAPGTYFLNSRQGKSMKTKKLIIN